MGVFTKGIAGKEDIQFKSSGTTKQTFTRIDASSRTLTLEQIDGAHIQFRTLAKSIDDLVDGGYDVAIKPQYIFGGGANTVGHTVPNVADDQFVMQSNTETIDGVKTFSGNNTHSGTMAISGVTTFTATRKGDHGADVASEATLFDANGFPADGNTFDITGTTDITAITGSGQVGTVIHLHFDGALTFTHHTTDLVLPGTNNITTYAGMELTLEEYSSGDWRLIGGAILPHDHADANAGGGMLSSTVPTFSVVKSSDQGSVVTSIDTIVTWETEQWDTGPCFGTDAAGSNAAANRFNPGVAGKYFLTTQLRIGTNVADTTILAKIFKNGSLEKFSLVQINATSSIYVNCSCVVDANGSTDYFEVILRHTAGSDRSLSGDTNSTWFQGYKILGT